jgi:hypothetical protein
VRVFRTARDTPKAQAVARFGAADPLFGKCRLGAICVILVLNSGLRPEPSSMRTTQQIQREIARLNRLIARIESKPHREWAIWSSTLHELIEEREVLGLVISNRQLEASKKIVSFRRWRDGPWAA